MKYRVLVAGISYVIDAKLDRACRAGDQVDAARLERATRWPAVDDIVDDLPTGSVVWLIADGLIEEVSAA